MRSRDGTHRRRFRLLVALVLIAGCRGEEQVDDRLDLIRVTGSVSVGGKPAEGARVTLHPVTGPAVDAGLYPQGRADDSGKFSLTTYETGDGAPVGEYKVAVVWPDDSFEPKTIEEIEAVTQGGALPDKLRGRYSNPERSKLTATIEENTAELPPFELK